MIIYELDGKNNLLRIIIRDTEINHIATVGIGDGKTEKDIIETLSRRLKLVNMDQADYTITNSIDRKTKMLSSVKIIDLSSMVNMQEAVELAVECFKPEFQQLITIYK